VSATSHYLTPQTPRTTASVHGRTPGRAKTPRPGRGKDTGAIHFSCTAIDSTPESSTASAAADQASNGALRNGFEPARPETPETPIRLSFRKVPAFVGCVIGQFARLHRESTQFRQFVEISMMNRQSVARNMHDRRPPILRRSPV